VRQQVGLPDPRRRGNLKDHAALLMEGFVGDKVKVEIGRESGTQGSLMIRSLLAPCRCYQPISRRSQSADRAGAAALQ